MQKKAKLGQNFLVDAAAQRAIADALGDVSTETLVEIGPGAAAITDLLARRARRLIAIELDANLAAALRVRFPEGSKTTEVGRVEVLNQDVLRVNLTAIAAGATASATDGRDGDLATLAVVGNLPYYITSDILLHLFTHHASISRAVLMVQREVADRMVARPGTSEYGMLSATCQLYTKPEKLFTLPPSAFSPPPEVHSSVVRLYFAPRFEELEVDSAGFLGYLRICFAQKRKTLANNLRAAGFDATQIAEAGKAAEVSPQARAESLSLEKQARLYRLLAAGQPFPPGRSRIASQDV